MAPSGTGAAVVASSNVHTIRAQQQCVHVHWHGTRSINNMDPFAKGAKKKVPVVRNLFN